MPRRRRYNRSRNTGRRRTSNRSYTRSRRMRGRSRRRSSHITRKRQVIGDRM